MRIAYISTYQGPSVVKQRPIVRNLSLAARVKIELVAELLQRSSHSVEILSQGEVIERQFRFFPGFRDADGFSPEIPVFYGSALPVRFVNGMLSSLSLLRLFKQRHRAVPFDLVMIYDLKPPQMACARYAIRKLGLPVILEYEDDAFTDVHGKPNTSVRTGWQRAAARKLLESVAGGFGCAPYLLEQISPAAAKLLLRGVVSSYIANANGEAKAAKANRVVFSGTLEGSQGVEQLVRAWQMLALPDWELHIAGVGPIKPALEKLAQGNPKIIFHGYLKKEENGKLLCSAKIGMNPQDVTRIPGNTFPFKIIEYIAAGLHVISTPRGKLEPELDAAVTYIPDNSDKSIAAALKTVLAGRRYERTAERAALQTYGPAAVSKGLNQLVADASARRSN